MGDSPLILGVSGLRGIVGESLTPEVAVRYAQAVGAWFANIDPYSDTHDIVVGHDGRAGHEVVYHAVISGLLAAGWGVVPIGRAMTPTIAVAVDQCEEVAGGIVITASHNPQQWNGIKVLNALVEPDDPGVGVSAPSARKAQQIIERFENSDFSWGTQEQREHFCTRVSEVTHAGVTTRKNVAVPADLDFDDLHALIVEFKLPQHGLDRRELGKLLAVIDSVNASGSTGSALICQRLGVRSVQLFGDDTGIFPHTPEPTKENLSGEGGLCDAVPGLKADIGFAQDPDADRLAIVDERGKYIGEEYTMVLCAMALMEARMGEEAGERRAGSPSQEGGEGQKPVFVVNLSTSRMIDDVAKHYGAEVVRTAVGEANVVEAMKSLKASGRDVVLGGEGNGGVIWPQVTYVRDSLSGMALTLSLMARTGKTVSQLVEMVNAMGPTEEVQAHGYTIIKQKSALASKADAEPVVKHLRGVYESRDDCRVDLQDGIRIDWDARGVWAHVRASNTEPIMRVIVEAPSAAEAQAVAAEIDGAIAGVRHPS